MTAIKNYADGLTEARQQLDTAIVAATTAMTWLPPGRMLQHLHVACSGLERTRDMVREELKAELARQTNAKP